MKTPILFIFWIKDTTKEVFNEIKKIKPQKLYLASDGPRKNNKEDINKIKELRKHILDNIDWPCKVKTLFRNKNLGCRKGVSEAIDWFFKNEEMGIILEDDTLPCQDFFKFCEEMLEYYKHNPKIGAICGFNPFQNDIQIDDSFLFSKYHICWGWATWRRVWEGYDVDIKDWEKIKKSFLFNETFDRWVVRQFWKALYDFIYYTNQHKGWAAQFSYLLYKNKMLSVVSSRNLIQNIGYNQKCSVHCTNDIPNYIEKAHINKLVFPLKFNEAMINNKMFDRLMENVHFGVFMELIKYKLKLFLSSCLGDKWYNFLKRVYQNVK